MKISKFRRYPISYYGGKNQLLKYLLPLIPKHELYCEPFIGGGAKYWAKEPSKIEVINDKNNLITNFYKVIKTDFEALSYRIASTLHSRNSYNEAMLILKSSEIYSDIDKAWCIWVLTNMSYGSIIGGGFGYNKKTTNSCAKKVNHKRFLFDSTEIIKKRLENTTIENANANEIIKRYDAENSYFYLDPPYIDTEQGHYEGYKSDDFIRDLDALPNLKGKFLLSSFDSDVLKEYVNKYKWNQIKIERQSSITNNKKKKIEVLTANFPISLPK